MNSLGWLATGAACYLLVHALAEDADIDVVYVATPHSAHRAAAGLCLEAGRNVLCEALLLVQQDAEPVSTGGTLGETLGSLFSWDGRRRDNGLLRSEGVPSYPASMIAGIRHRPLLATFARGVDLPAPLARHVHGLLLRTAPKDARCASCAGTGYVRGEPCLACS